MSRKPRNLLLALALIILIAFAALIGFMVGQPLVSAPMPNPNGYDDFVQAGGTVTGDVGKYSTLDENKLREVVLANTEPLHLLRRGLTRRCAVPTAVGMTNFGALTSDLAKFKALALLLATEGRLAELENHPGDAARSYFEVIRLGNETSRGGFMINRLVGVACEAIGARPLAKLLPGLSCEQARPIIAELENVDAGSVTWQEVMQTENTLKRHALQKSSNPVRLVITWWQLRPAKKQGEARHNIAIAHVRLLAIEAALRCFQIEQGHPPARLDELVPKYLDLVASDPFDGQPLVYQPHGTNWCSIV